MKNIQVIDGAENCTYDIYSIEEAIFETISPQNQDIEFYSDLLKRIGKEKTDEIFLTLWDRPCPKKKADGIHGTLFFELDYKKIYYPTKKEDEVETLI